LTQTRSSPGISDRFISFYGWSQVDAFFRAWRQAGFRPVGHIVWVKEYASRTRYLRYRHEQAYVLAKGRPALPAEPLDDIQPWTYSGNPDHPTQKSEAILVPLIEAFTQPGQVVLDPFAGSGSTLVAAAMTGRRYLGIELDRQYCAAARNRLACVERQCFPSTTRDNGSSALTFNDRRHREGGERLASNGTRLWSSIGRIFRETQDSLAATVVKHCGPWLLRISSPLASPRRRR
jgi:hypothetical protein